MHINILQDHTIYTSVYGKNSISDAIAADDKASNAISCALIPLFISVDSLETSVGKIGRRVGTNKFSQKFSNT